MALVGFDQNAPGVDEILKRWAKSRANAVPREPYDQVADACRRYREWRSMQPGSPWYKAVDVHTESAEDVHTDDVHEPDVDKRVVRDAAYWRERKREQRARKADD